MFARALLHFCPGSAPCPEWEHLTLSNFFEVGTDVQRLSIARPASELLIKTSFVIRRREVRLRCCALVSGSNHRWRFGRAATSAATGPAADPHRIDSCTAGRVAVQP